jgi:hypothetical protein
MDPAVWKKDISGRRREEISKDALTGKGAQKTRSAWTEPVERL